MKSCSKYFWVCMVKNGCDQFSHGTLKLTVSQEWMNGMNWVLVCLKLFHWFLSGCGEIFPHVKGRISVKNTIYRKWVAVWLWILSNRWLRSPNKFLSWWSASYETVSQLKSFYSVILLALLDVNYRFVWGSLGAPGNTHDSTLFLSARLWSNVLSEDVLFEAAFKIHDDIIVPPLILLSIEIILAKTVWGSCAIRQKKLF